MKPLINWLNLSRTAGLTKKTSFSTFTAAPKASNVQRCNLSNILFSSSNPMFSIEPLHPQIILLHNLFTKTQCKQIINESERLGYNEATVDVRAKRDATNTNNVMRKDIRNNDRIVFNDQELARDLYNYVNPSLNLGDSIMSFSSQFRFYRYSQGQHFKKHPDGIFVDKENQLQSKYTFLIYLNDDFQGGETTIHIGSSPIIIKPYSGLGLIFYHKFLHQGEIIQNGFKYVLRTDLMIKTQSNSDSKPS
jgi:prolyl 4-hydroxylase